MDRIPIDEWPPPAILSRRINWLRVAGFAGLVAVATGAVATTAILVAFKVQSANDPEPEAAPAPAVAWAATEGSAAPHPGLQLVTEATPVGTERAPLGISVRGPSDLAARAAVEITGLPDGWSLSEGRQLGNRWRIPAGKLAGAAILPSPGLASPGLSSPGPSGAVDVEVELRLADDTVAERRVLHWAATTSPESGQETPAAANPAAASTGAADVGNPEARDIAAANVAAEKLAAEKFAMEKVLAEHTTYLLSKADDLLANKDIAAARLVLQRAAESGHPGAALTLALTYEGCSVPCTDGDANNRSQALYWYQRAAEMGSTEARQRLDRLTSQPSSMTAAAAPHQK